MAEEFQESDVIFSDLFYTRHGEDPLFGYPENSAESKINDNNSKRRKTRRSEITAAYLKSVPVNVPENVLRNYVEKLPEEFSDEEYSGGGEIIPPHVIVAKRIQGQMAFSLCSGNGRTLKGRDLSRVRNSVLRMTGFLEA